MELWDIYDMNRERTGEVVERGSALADSVYHLVVHICLFNSRGQMLIQQRQPFKVGWPNLWDVTVGGNAVAGDSSQMAAERELFEEIGVKADFSGVRPHFSINFAQGFDDYYLIERNLDVNSLSLQPEEVQRVKWADQAEILRLIETGEFLPYYPSLIAMCFQMRNDYGSHAV